jgi:hypothetical protein
MLSTQPLRRPGRFAFPGATCAFHPATPPEPDTPGGGKRAGGSASRRCALPCKALFKPNQCQGQSSAWYRGHSRGPPLGRQRRAALESAGHQIGWLPQRPDRDLVSPQLIIQAAGMALTRTKRRLLTAKCLYFGGCQHPRATTEWRFVRAESNSQEAG